LFWGGGGGGGGGGGAQYSVSLVVSKVRKFQHVCTSFCTNILILPPHSPPPPFFCITSHVAAAKSYGIEVFKRESVYVCERERERVRECV